MSRSFSTPPPTSKLAAHLAQMRVRDAAVQEDRVCELLDIPSLRPFQRDVLEHLGVIESDRPANVAYRRTREMTF